MTLKQRYDIADIFLVRMYLYNTLKDNSIPSTTRVNLTLELDCLRQMCDALDIKVKINKDDSLKYTSVVLNGKEYKV